MEHPKDVGDKSTLAIMLALRETGYGVLVPFGENTRYDLVIDDGCALRRVQCKTGRLRRGAVVWNMLQPLWTSRQSKKSEARLRGRSRRLCRLLPRNLWGVPDPNDGPPDPRPRRLACGCAEELSGEVHPLRRHL